MVGRSRAREEIGHRTIIAARDRLCGLAATNVPLPAGPHSAPLCTSSPTNRGEQMSRAHHHRPHRSRRRRRSCRGRSPGSARQGRRRSPGQPGTCTTAATSKLKLSAENSGHRGRVRGRSEPERHPVARHRCGATERSSRRRPRRRTRRAARSRSGGSSPAPRASDRIVAVAKSPSGATCTASASL